MPELKDEEAVIAATRAWLERDVIGLNLCPFARAVHEARRIRYAVSGAKTAGELRAALEAEARLLVSLEPAKTETTLLIHPLALGDFLEYNDFLDEADAVLEELGLTGVLQVASFHPRYLFAGLAPDDPANGTNRSPYPMLHLLREESVERAIREYPDAGTIPARNVETMRRRARE